MRLGGASPSLSFSKHVKYRAHSKGHDMFLADSLCQIVSPGDILPTAMVCLFLEKIQQLGVVTMRFTALLVLFSGLAVSVLRADDKPQVPPPNAEAVAAIKALGGNVMQIAQNDAHLDVTLHLASSDVTDDALAQVAKLEGVVWLNLAGTKITSAGLAHIKGMKSLQRLHLEKTEVGDEGVCDHHRPQPATASVPGDPVHRVGHDAVVGGPSPRRGEVIRVIGIVGGAVVERAGNRQRVEERDGVDRDGPTVVAAAGVGDHDRIGQPGRI